VTNTPGLRHSWIISQEPEIPLSKYFGEFYTKNIARGSQIIDLYSTEKSNDVIASSALLLALLFVTMGSHLALCISQVGDEILESSCL
jgi:hypothetical protein